MADLLNGAVIQLPNRIDHRMIVGVENIFFVFRVPGDVDLRDSFGGNTVHVFERVKAVILRRDVNVVHIEQNSTIRAFHDFVQKFPFRHFRNVKFGVATHVFHCNRYFQKIAHLADFLRRLLCGFKRIRHGKQVVRVSPIDASPAQVIGNPRSLGPLH